MIWVEFIQDYKFPCWKKGTIREVQDHFAHVLIEQGIAKAIDKPAKHKMIEHPEKEKRHYFTG